MYLLGYSYMQGNVDIKKKKKTINKACFHFLTLE